MNITDDTDMTSLVDAMDECGEMALLSGAGISWRPGVPTAPEIVEKLAEEYAGVSTGMDYADAWEQALPGPENAGQRRSLIEQWIAGRPPISGHYPPPKGDDELVGSHYLVAQLMETGYLDGILTTNFDHLHEQALNNYCSRLHRIYQHEEVIDHREFQYDYPKLFKLHGDFLYDNLANRDPEMRRRVNKSMRTKIVDYLRDRGLIVIGYSGGDDSIMTLLKEAAADDRALSGGLWWVSYSHMTLADKPKIEALKEAMVTAGKQFHLIHPPADNGRIPAHKFLHLLCERLAVPEPEVPPFGVHRDKRHVLDSITSHFGTPRQFPIAESDQMNSSTSNDLRTAVKDTVETKGVTWITEPEEIDLSPAFNAVREMVEPDRPFLYFSYRFSYNITWQQFIEDTKLVANSADITTTDKTDYTEILKALFNEGAVVIIDDLGFSANTQVEKAFWRHLCQLIRIHDSAQAGNLILASPSLPPERQLMDLHHARFGTNPYPGGQILGNVVLTAGINPDREFFFEHDGTKQLAAHGVHSEWPAGDLDPLQIGFQVIDPPLVSSSGEARQGTALSTRLDTLSHEGLEMMKLLSVLRYAEPADVLRDIYDGPVLKLLDELTSKELVESRNGKYWPRLPVREYVLSAMITDEEQTHLHQQIGETLASVKETARQQLGMHYAKEAEAHLWEADEYTAALRNLLKIGDALIDHGYAEFVYETLSDFFELQGIDHYGFFFDLVPIEQVKALVLYNQSGNKADSVNTDSFVNQYDALIDSLFPLWPPRLRALYAGTVSEANQDFEAAIKSFETGIELMNPGESDTLLAAARYGAYRNHRHFLDQNTYDEDEYHYHLQRFLELNGLALDCYRRLNDDHHTAICLDDRAGVLLGLERVEESTKALDAAIEHFTTLEGLTPDKGTVYGNKCSMHMLQARNAATPEEFLEELRLAEGFYLEAALNYEAGGNYEGILRLFRSLLRSIIKEPISDVQQNLPKPSHVVAWAFEVWKMDHQALEPALMALYKDWVSYIAEQANYILLLTVVEQQNKLYRYNLETSGHYWAFNLHLMLLDRVSGVFDTDVLKDQFIPKLEATERTEVSAYRLFLDYLEEGSSDAAFSEMDIGLPEKYSRAIQEYLDTDRHDGS